MLLAGVLTGSVFSAKAEVAGVVAMAQPESGVSIDKLSLAVYDAVKAQPNKAVDIYLSVVSQRSSWSVTETYALIRSVLLAAPHMEAEFIHAAAESIENGSTVVSVENQGGELLSYLYNMAQTKAVADAVVQGVIGSALSVRAAGNGISQSYLEAYIPAPPVAPEYPVTPTPPPTSANN